VATEQRQALSQSAVGTPAFADCRLEHVPSVLLFESPGGKALSEIPCAGKFTVLQSSDGWDKVQTGDGSVGWVRPNFVSFTTPQQCQTGETWVTNSFGGRCVNNAAAEALRQTMLGAEANKEAENRANGTTTTQSPATVPLYQQQAVPPPSDETSARPAKHHAKHHGFRNAMAAFAQGAGQAGQQYAQQPHVTCTTQQIGNTAYTNCY
jgi:hypothetical protein